MDCAHEDWFFLGDLVFCPDCDAVVGARCPECGGDGCLPDDTAVRCSECGGEGWTTESSVE